MPACPTCGIDEADLRETIDDLRQKLDSMRSQRNQYYTEATGDELEPGSLLSHVLDMD